MSQHNDSDKDKKTKNIYGAYDWLKSETDKTQSAIDDGSDKPSLEIIQEPKKRGF